MVYSRLSIYDDPTMALTPGPGNDNTDFSRCMSDWDAAPAQAAGALAALETEGFAMRGHHLL
jgi:hypothetical protein